MGYRTELSLLDKAQRELVADLLPVGAEVAAGYASRRLSLCMVPLHTLETHAVLAVRVGNWACLVQETAMQFAINRVLEAWEKFRERQGTRIEVDHERLRPADFDEYGV